MSTLLQSLIDPKKNFLARMHMKAVSTRLRRYGQISIENLNFPNLDFVESDLLCLPLCVIDWNDSGLRYDDLFDQYESMDIKEALNRLPREVVDARNQRLKRAMDLSMKHEYLPKDLQVTEDIEQN